MDISIVIVVNMEIFSLSLLACCHNFYLFFLFPTHPRKKERNSTRLSLDIFTSRPLRTWNRPWYCWQHIIFLKRFRAFFSLPQSMLSGVCARGEKHSGDDFHHSWKIKRLRVKLSRFAIVARYDGSAPCTWLDQRLNFPAVQIHTYIMWPRYTMLLGISLYVALEINIVSLFDVVGIKRWSER